MVTKRRTSWLDSLPGFSVASGAQASATLITGSVDTDGYTLTRLIGHIQVHPLSPAGATGVMRVDMGLGMFEADAIAAAAFPDPVVSTDEPGRGWIWRDSLTIEERTSSTEPHMVVIRFDIRAQRKIDKASMVWVVDNTQVIGTAFTVTMRGIFRSLCLT